jgi:uncharacterized repeat protein (TIGR03803 family)
MPRGSQSFSPAHENAAAVVYNFCAQSNCSDGAIPFSPLLEDKSGVFFGTTIDGGAFNQCNSGSGCGTVFRLTPTASGVSEDVLWSFGGAGDGQAPQGGLLEDSTGALYGTTTSGGAHQYGIVYKLTPVGKKYTETVLYNFCSQAGCSDGADPQAGLVSDEHGTLYGTAYGTDTSYGNVYKLTPRKGGYSESVLYTFCSRTGCSDGKSPRQRLVVDTRGSLFGTTFEGGNGCNCGTIFSLALKRHAYVLTTLWRFNGPAVGGDGYWPSSPLTLTKNGSLVGTTELGGSSQTCIVQNAGCGTVFELQRSKKQYAETVLWRFNLADGAMPSGGITQRGGAFYGSTIAGGPNVCLFAQTCGTIFKLARSGNAYKERVLWDFENQQTGFFPAAAPVFDASGNLYATTNFGGANTCTYTPQGCGTILRLQL